jgi:hypothetical protein
LRLWDTIKLGIARGLLPELWVFLFRVDADYLEHSCLPIGWCVIAERPFRHLDTPRQGVEVALVLGLSEGWEFLNTISAPAEKEVEGESGKQAEDRIGIPHTTHVFNLPVLV